MRKHGSYLPLPVGPWGPLRLLICTVVLIVLCFSGGGIVLTSMVKPSVIDPLGLSETHATALTVLLEKSLSLVVALIVGLIVLRPLSARLLGAEWLRPRRWVAPVVWGIAGVILLNVIVALLDRVTGREGGGSGTLLTSAGIGSGTWADIAVVLSIGALGPVFEEFLYRAFLHRSMRDLVVRLGQFAKIPSRAAAWVGIFAGCVVSSMMFVDLHNVVFGDAMYVIFFVYGAIAVLVYEVTGSLYAAVIFHAGQNSWAMAQSTMGSDLGMSALGWVALVAAPFVAVLLTWLVGRLLDITGGDRERRTA